MGEAKNWEKLGSCAFDILATATQRVRVESIFFITAIMFFHWSDRFSSGTLPPPAININVVCTRKLPLSEAYTYRFRIRNGKIQQFRDPKKSGFVA
jgi:hypothetical protein